MKMRQQSQNLDCLNAFWRYSGTWFVPGKMCGQETPSLFKQAARNFSVGTGSGQSGLYSAFDTFCCFSNVSFWTTEDLFIFLRIRFFKNLHSKCKKNFWSCCFPVWTDKFHCRPNNLTTKVWALHLKLVVQLVLKNCSFFQKNGNRAIFKSIKVLSLVSTDL